MATDSVLYLEDGTSFAGRSFGAPGDCLGEVVFNTAMTGYQEVLTDPSYAGQIVIMTSPQIGNYGANPEDEESGGPQVAGFVVRECSPIFSNWRGQFTLDAYLAQHGVRGIAELDTRALVRHIRTRGAMRGIVASAGRAEPELRRRVLAHPSMEGSDYVRQVTTQQAYQVDPEARRFRVVAYDFGIKRNILRCLAERGCQVTVVPAATLAEDALSLDPDGIFLSNGPGDPEPLTYAIDNVRRLLGQRPVFGICLGHQLLGLALGGRTFKMKFGHRGGNQPVKNLLNGRVEITSHNHGFAVDPDSLDPGVAEPTHLNLNDQTLEGIRHRSLPAFSVQYHPEASPGPHDSLYLFDDFVRMMDGWRNRK